MTLTKEEKNIIINMICAEQLKCMIVKEKYNSEEYKNLEKLKIKIKTV